MSAALLADAAVAVATNGAVLDQILVPHIELALWCRERPPQLQWIDSLAWDAIDDLDFPVPVAALEPEIADALKEAGYAECDDVRALHQEILALARRFSAVIGCDWIRLRLEVVETDACRKFHADVVTARLLTTLSGPATQWIEATTPDRIHQMATGDVAIFKGRLWAEESAILHRSPPISGTGDKRLLLAINPHVPASEVTHV